MAFIGAGLLEQIAPSNRRYYTRLTAELLEDFLFDLSYNVLGTNERKFVALTGEMGMREFDRVLKEKMANMNLIDTVFVTGSGDNLKFGGQFTLFLYGVQDGFFTFGGFAQFLILRLDSFNLHFVQSSRCFLAVTADERDCRSVFQQAEGLAYLSF